MRSLGVTFLLPAKNEEKTIGIIINKIKEYAEEIPLENYDIVVINDSCDKTEDIAKGCSATVIDGGGLGLGFAMRKGLEYASQLSNPIVISLDSDGQVDLSEIILFYRSLVENKVDMVIGSRFKDKNLIDYNYKFLNRWGVRILSYFLRKMTNLDITDSHGGIRSFTKEVAKSLELKGNHTYVQESIIDAYEKGFQIIEIPSRWTPRSFGGSRVVRSVPIYIYLTLPVLLSRLKKRIKASGE